MGDVKFPIIGDLRKAPKRKALEQKNDMQRGKSSRHDSENIGKKRRQSVQCSVLIPPRVHYNFTA